MIQFFGSVTLFYNEASVSFAIWQWIAATLIALACVVLAHKPLHLLQLESYQLDGYFRALNRGTKGYLREGIVTLVVTGISIIAYILLLSVLTPFSASSFGAIGGSSAIGVIGSADGPTSIFVSSGGLWLAPFCLLSLLISFPIVYFNNRRAKKPLKRTKRVIRLMICLFFLNLLISVFLSSVFREILVLLPLISQLFVVPLAALIMQPVEKNINMSFFRDAQKRLVERPDLIKIGITGSYGKTSTKFILAAILGEKYNVLATPSSFNTPMGLTRVIRETLEPEHEVFIAEMGARHVGDIKELCELVSPKYGAITSIGPQHLETFHSLENVANTKYELINALPSDGAAFFSDDGGECKKLYDRVCACEKTLAGLFEHDDVRAENVRVGREGSSFDLVFKGGKRVSTHTQLLGAHNIANITLCCAIAEALGLSPEQIASGVTKAPPVEHRLQLIRGAGGNIVIDDAFNSNPAGAKAAMDVLSQFDGRRIVVTPGMVELGEREEELNREFGKRIAAACEVAVLIGETRTKPIYAGILEAGFVPENILIVKTLDEAAAWIAANAQPGDVTLFENDLPDNYSE